MLLDITRLNGRFLKIMFSELTDTHFRDHIGDFNDRLVEASLSGNFRVPSRGEMREYPDAALTLDIDLRLSGIRRINYDQIARTVVMLVSFHLGFEATYQCPDGGGEIDATNVGGFIQTIDSGREYDTATYLRPGQYE